MVYLSSIIAKGIRIREACKYFLRRCMLWKLIRLVIRLLKLLICVVVWASFSDLSIMWSLFNSNKLPILIQGVSRWLILWRIFAKLRVRILFRLFELLFISVVGAPVIDLLVIILLLSMLHLHSLVLWGRHRLSGLERIVLWKLILLFLKWLGRIIRVNISCVILLARWDGMLRLFNHLIVSTGVEVTRRFNVARKHLKLRMRRRKG